MKNKNIRVLVILPMQGGSLPIGYYCAKALEEMGISVRIFDAPIFNPTFFGLRNLDIAPNFRDDIEATFLQVVSKAIFAQIQSFEPHLVLALAQAPIRKQILVRLKKLGIRTCMWFVEDYKLFQYWQMYAPLYDAFCIIQKEPFIQALYDIGQKNVLYLPLAGLPSFHKKIELTPEEQKYYGADIGFLGAGYPNRRLAFRHLAGRKFKIWGSDWDDEPLLAKNIQKAGQRIDPNEGLKIYSATTINLNLHSSIHTDTLVSHGDFVNPRTFELASMGVFQLTDKRTLMPELFAEDSIATFESIEEFYQKIDFFLHHPEERLRYCKNAQKEVTLKHTYHHRMKTLLDFIEERVGFSTFDQDRHPHTQSVYQSEITTMLNQINASPNAQFNDVIARIRKRNACLTIPEVSLLFLDEWQKQYKGRS